MSVVQIHHLTLTVADRDRSAAWYVSLLGSASVTQREAPGWRRTRLQWPTGLIIGLTQHEATAGDDRFDCTRVGMDHIGLGCSSEAEVRDWAARMDAAGIVHGPIEDVPYGWAVTARDPDGIAIEFFCPKR